MADVKRYMLEWSNALGEHMGEHPDGAWVTYEDYAALDARCLTYANAIGDAHEELAALKAENERLKENQRREGEDFESICRECDGSGWSVYVIDN